MWLPQNFLSSRQETRPFRRAVCAAECQRRAVRAAARAYQELLLRKAKQVLNKVNFFLAAEVSMWKMEHKEIRTGSL